MTDLNKESLDNVLRRIAKLLAIAQDDRANPHEAAAAAGQAERIMRKYQIENADLIKVQLKNDPNATATADCVANAKTNGTKAESVPPWANWISTAVAQLNECGALIVRHADGNVGIRFYGYTADVTVAKYMFDYLVATINRLAKAYKDTDDYRINGRGVLTTYRKGVSMGILSQLNKQQAQKTAEQAATVVTGTSLMVVKQQVLAEKFGEAVFKTKKSKTKIDHSADSFGEGLKDGRKVDINVRGINNTGGDLKRIAG